jgi:3-hydroxyacyl-CoA dehydrogenase
MSVKKIAVIGAGLMGSGISYVSAWSKYDVTMVDVDDESLESGMNRLRSYVKSGIERGKLSDSEAEDLLSRIRLTTSLEEAVSDVDLVIEAIYENMEVKKDLFKRMDSAASPRTILASNTSSLSISELGKSTGRPTKVIGMHYFSPVPAMKLLEIIVGEQTTEDTIDTALAVGHSQGKITVRAKDSPGFIVNRLGAQILRNSVLVIEQGIATAGEIDSAMKEHFMVPMGPLELTDFVGIDISFNTMSTLYRELGDCFSPPATLTKLVESGTIGRKTGSGFYEYGGQQSSSEKPKGADSAVIALRIIVPYLREAMIEVETGIASEEDIDKAMKLGRNFKEGPFETIERLGRKTVREELRKLQNQFGDCYSLPKMLQ